MKQKCSVWREKKKKKTNENLSNLLARKQQADRGKGNPFKQKSN